MVIRTRICGAEIDSDDHPCMCLPYPRIGSLWLCCFLLTDPDYFLFMIVWVLKIVVICIMLFSASSLMPPKPISYRREVELCPSARAEISEPSRWIQTTVRSKLELPLFVRTGIAVSGKTFAGWLGTPNSGFTGRVEVELNAVKAFCCSNRESSPLLLLSLISVSPVCHVCRKIRILPISYATVEISQPSLNPLSVAKIFRLLDD